MLTSPLYIKEYKVPERTDSGAKVGLPAAPRPQRWGVIPRTSYLKGER